MKDIFLIGNGGFSKEVRDILEMQGKVVAGFIEPEPSESNDSYKDIESVEEYFKPHDTNAFLAIGAVNDLGIKRRYEIINLLREMKYSFETVISPLANLSTKTKIEQGAFVAHGVTLSIDCIIKSNALINSNAIIGHDAEIGENTIIAPGAFIGGNVIIGSNCLIGPNANILQGVTIPSGSIIGVNTNIYKSFSDSSIVKPIKSNIIKK